MKVSGCGIIPISMKNNKLYVFCGFENGCLSDLGGKINSNEDYKLCAAREFYEESVGLLLPYQELVTIKTYKRLKIGSKKCYLSYIIKVPYKEVDDEYQKMLDYIEENNCQPKKMNFHKYNLDMLYEDKIYPEGFFELESLCWIPLEDLKNNKYKLRNRFKELIRMLK